MAGESNQSRPDSPPASEPTRQRVVPYREKALDRLSSPEQLDQLLLTTRPHGWLALSALLLLFMTGLSWAIFGTVSTEVDGKGILLRPEATDGSLQAVVYLPLNRARQVREGMEARISPLLTDRGAPGDVAGRVAEVGSFPVSLQAVEQVVESPAVAEELVGEGLSLEVRVELPSAGKEASETEGGASGRATTDGWLEAGRLVGARILIRREHPIELLVPTDPPSRED